MVGHSCFISKPGCLGILGRALLFSSRLSHTFWIYVVVDSTGDFFIQSHLSDIISLLSWVRSPGLCLVGRSLHFHFQTGNHSLLFSPGWSDWNRVKMFPPPPPHLQGSRGHCVFQTGGRAPSLQNQPEERESQFPRCCCWKLFFYVWLLDNLKHLWLIKCLVFSSLSHQCLPNFLLLSFIWHLAFGFECVLIPELEFQGMELTAGLVWKGWWQFNFCRHNST